MARHPGFVMAVLNCNARRTAGALTILMAAAAWPGVSHAVTRIVTNCADSGPGSLRNTIAASTSGDTVDMSGLQCFNVFLTGVQIEVPQENLRIIGRYNLVVSAQQFSRVFHHSGTGTFRLERVNMREGFHSAPFATGGCLHSEGSVQLISSTMDSCLTFTAADPGMSMGGAIYAHRVLVSHSRINNSRTEQGFVESERFGGAIASDGHVSVHHSLISFGGSRIGGGIYSEGGVTVTYSTLSNNGALRSGAAIEVTGGTVTINKSTLSSNVSGGRCGALCAFGSERTHIMDSTFSNNYATYLAAGELSDEALITNSTIAFNLSGSGSECVGVIRAKHLELQSSILAANKCVANSPPYDLGGRSWEGYTVRGANNLIGRSHIPVPTGTVTGDPGLDPILANNGGPTDVHALLTGSIAIDRGNNRLNRAYDQRGPGYPRVRGVRADIGAYER